MGHFEFFGAFIAWILSGFKGNPMDRLKPEMNFRLAYLGLFTLLILTVTTLVIIGVTGHF
jgi:hypothetical protein